MRGVLPREVAQAVKVLTTLDSTSGIGDVGKELPRNKSVVSVLFVGEPAHVHDREVSQHARLFRGYHRVNHCCTRCSSHST